MESYRCPLEALGLKFVKLAELRYALGTITIVLEKKMTINVEDKNQFVKILAAEIIKSYKIDGRNKAKVNFFIGAGCSVTAGMPLANDVAKKGINLLYEYENQTDQEKDSTENSIEEKLKLLIEQGKINKKSNGGGLLIKNDIVNWGNVYEELFSNGYKSPNQSRNFFSKLVEESGGAINWSHICLGQLAYEKLLSTVITTNFDRLVVRGMVYAGVVSLVCDDMQNINKITENQDVPQVIEVHGSYFSYNLANKNADIKNKWKIFSGCFESIYKSSDALIFIGFSGSDKSIMKFICEASEKYQDVPIYWVFYEKEWREVGGRVKNFLSKKKIQANLVYNYSSDDFFSDLMRELKIEKLPLISYQKDKIERQMRLLGISDIINKDISHKIKLGSALFNEIGELASASPFSKKQEDAAEQIKILRNDCKLTEAYNISVQYCDIYGDDIFQDAKSISLKLANEIGISILSYGSLLHSEKDISYAGRIYANLLSSHSPEFSEIYEITTYLGEAEYLLTERHRRPINHDNLDLLNKYEKTLDSFIEKATSDIDRVLLQGKYSKLLIFLSTLYHRKGREEKSLILENEAKDKASVFKKYNNLKKENNGIWGYLNYNYYYIISLSRDVSDQEKKNACAAYKNAMSSAQFMEEMPILWIDGCRNFEQTALKFSFFDKKEQVLEETVIFLRKALHHKICINIPSLYSEMQFLTGDALLRLGKIQNNAGKFEESIFLLESYVKIRSSGLGEIFKNINRNKIIAFYDIASAYYHYGMIVNDAAKLNHSIKVYWQIIKNAKFHDYLDPLSKNYLGNKADAAIYHGFCLAINNYVTLKRSPINFHDGELDEIFFRAINMLEKINDKDQAEILRSIHSRLRGIQMVFK
ncbi:SIR2 family protein [Phaeospirillum tilakii]|uniref:SIR2 family protein n=1 Tax=Phaeospirillum tilakii TaxID=741673 RepID=A0ABW5CFC3_9PROT